MVEICPKKKQVSTLYALSQLTLSGAGGRCATRSGPYLSMSLFRVASSCSFSSIDFRRCWGSSYKDVATE